MSNDRKVDSMSKWEEDAICGLNKFLNDKMICIAVIEERGIVKEFIKPLVKKLLEEQRKVYKEKIAMLEAKCEVLENDLDNAYD